MRGRAFAHAAQGWVVVGADAFAPSAVGILHHAQPFRGLLYARLVVVHANRFESAQHQGCAVDVVHAPAAEPASIGLLFIADELDGALHGGMVLIETIGRHHFEDAARDIDCRRIEHGVVIGEWDVLEHHLVVVFVE